MNRNKIDKILTVAVCTVVAVIVFVLGAAMVIGANYSIQKYKLKSTAADIYTRNIDSVVITDKTLKKITKPSRAGFDIDLIYIVTVRDIATGKEYIVETLGTVFQCHTVGDTINVGELYLF